MAATARFRCWPAQGRRPRRRNTTGSESHISPKLPPERRLPAIYFQCFGIQGCHRHGGGRIDDLVFCRDIRWHFEFAFRFAVGLGQTVDGQTEAGKHIIVDDVVQENRFRIERLLVQDDTIVE